MNSVCFYFQVHQPHRLKPFSFFDTSQDGQYFDEELNASITRKVAHKCYLPANQLLLRLINQYGDAFKVAFSISGMALEQFERYCPEVLHSFQRLVETGCVELLGETYYHSLASVYCTREFEAQVALHSDAMRRHFGQQPTVFRNTELIYDDGIGQRVADLGFKGIIAEGADDILDWRSPNFVYRVPGYDTALLLKNYRLSDDIAFRFSNRSWNEYPLTADKFARWVHQVSGNGNVVNLFMDYETFGEHQWESTGIFQFMEHLPHSVFAHPDWEFCTPSETIERYEPSAELHYPRLTSWADIERDITAWRGNSMQERALNALYALAEDVHATSDAELLSTFRKLQTSDHFYYMCTKWFADGDVHAYFSPYESPYDAFITYKNVLRNFSRSLEDRAGHSVEPEATPASESALVAADIG